MPRYRIDIEYDGTNFSGFQYQQDALSVQAVLEEAIFKFCGLQLRISAAGRTDKGVHALLQVAHFDLEKVYPPHEVMNALNHYLKPHQVAVIAAYQVDDNFHARFSAVQRSYIYKIINRRSPLVLMANRAWHVVKPLDVPNMQAAAKLFEGTHDFTSFRASDCQAKSPIRTIDSIEVIQIGDTLEIHISARSFLHNMVRIIVGSLVKVGKGEWPPEHIYELLLVKNRTKSGPTAPAHGLYFAKVKYNHL